MGRCSVHVLTPLFFIYRELTDISILNCFIHLRYVVRTNSNNLIIIKQCLCRSKVMFPLNYTIMWSTLFCLLFLQDISGNQLRDVSPLNSLTHLLTLKAERNLLHSAKLDEVSECSLSRVILLNLWNEQYVTIISTQYTVCSYLRKQAYCMLLFLFFCISILFNFYFIYAFIFLHCIDLRWLDPVFFGGYHPTLKLSGIPTFTFIVSLTHRMDNI